MEEKLKNFSISVYIKLLGYFSYLFHECFLVLIRLYATKSKMNAPAFTTQQKVRCATCYIESQSITQMRRRFHTKYGMIHLAFRLWTSIWKAMIKAQQEAEDLKWRSWPIMFSFPNSQINLVHTSDDPEEPYWFLVQQFAEFRKFWFICFRTN